MAGINWKRVLTIGIAVLLSQQLLRDFVAKLAPKIMEFGFGNVTIAGIIAVGIGIIVGELVVDKVFK